MTLAPFAGTGAGQPLSVRNPRRSWLTRWNSARNFYWGSAGWALGGAALISYAVAASSGLTIFLVGGLWLVLAANWFFVARQLRRRERLGYGQVLPGAEEDVLTLVRQGRKIEAIKRYRQLNPGIGLREAKHVIDQI